MILHKSKFVEIIYQEENSLIIDKFLSTTETMTSEDFQSEMTIFAEMCEKYQPANELVHLIDMKYVIGLEMQEWTNKEIFPRYENIIKRMAFLVPTELFTQVSVEQTMDESTGQKFVQKYFENEDDAVKWLLNN